MASNLLAMASSLISLRNVYFLSCSFSVQVLQVCANKLQDGDSTEAEKEDGIGIPPLQ